MYAKEKQFAFLGIFSGEPFRQEEPLEFDDMTIVRRTGFNVGIVWYGHLVVGSSSRAGSHTKAYQAKQRLHKGAHPWDTSSMLEGYLVDLGEREREAVERLVSQQTLNRSGLIDEATRKGEHLNGDSQCLGKLHTRREGRSLPWGWRLVRGQRREGESATHGEATCCPTVG